MDAPGAYINSRTHTPYLRFGTTGSLGKEEQPHFFRAPPPNSDHHRSTRPFAAGRTARRRAGLRAGRQGVSKRRRSATRACRFHLWGSNPSEAIPSRCPRSPGDARGKAMCKELWAGSMFRSARFRGCREGDLHKPNQ